MKIERLRIRNFRSIEDLDVDLGPVTLFTGPNGAGKSTIQGSLEFLVSGKTPWTGERAGSGLDVLLRDGAELAEVTVTSPGGQDSVTRSIPHGLTMTGAPPNLTLAEAQGRLEELMGCSGEWARLSLRSGRYFSMKPEDQKALLYDLLGLHLTDRIVQEELVAKEERCGLPMVEMAQRLLKGPVTNNFGRIHDICYKERTAVGRSIKSAKERLKAELEREKKEEVAQHQPPPADQVQAIQEELHRIQQALAARSAAMSALARAERDVSRLQAEVAELEGTLQNRPDAAAIRRALEKAEGLLAERRSEKAALHQAEAERTTALESARALKEQIRALEAAIQGSATCPFRAGHPCARAGAEHRPALIAEHKTLAAQVQGLIPTATAPDPAPQIQEKAEAIQKGEGIIRDLRSKLDDAQGWARRQGQLDEKRRTLEATRAALEEARAALATHNPQDELEVELRNVLERKKALDEKTQWAREWAEHVGAINAYRRQIEDDEKTRTVLNELVHFFGPDGLQREALAAKIEPIQAELDGILGRWGMGCSYELPHVLLKVRTHTGGALVDFGRLSDAEQILVALAHQVVFSVLTGFRVVVIDRIEALDKTHQERLFQTTLDLADLVDHILLLGVSARVMPPQGMRYHNLGGPALGETGRAS